MDKNVKILTKILFTNYFSGPRVRISLISTPRIMASPTQIETLPSLAAMHEEVADLLPTQKFHGSVRVPGMREDIGWTLEVPEDYVAYEGLVLLIPGLGCIKRYSRGERHANAVAGEPTISYEPPRLSTNTAEDILHADKLQGRAADAVLSNVQLLFKGLPVVPNADHIDPHRVTLSSHSMGGYAATNVGLWRSGEIDAAIYKAAAGFGSPSWRALHQLKLGRTVGEIIDYLDSEQVEVTPRNIWRSVHYFARNPGRTLGEVVTCLTRDITEEVVALGEEDVPTAYLGFEHDGLVPVQPVEPTIRKVVDIFELMPGMGHLAPQRYPVETAAAVRGLRHRLRP